MRHGNGARVNGWRDGDGVRGYYRNDGWRLDDGDDSRENDLMRHGNGARMNGWRDGDGVRDYYPADCDDGWRLDDGDDFRENDLMRHGNIARVNGWRDGNDARENDAHDYYNAENNNGDFQQYGLRIRRCRTVEHYFAQHFHADCTCSPDDDILDQT